MKKPFKGLWTPSFQRRTRPHLGSNPLKGPANQIIVQSSASATHHSKYIHLLEDERVKKWMDYVSRGSSITAQVYFRRVGRVCTDNGILPSDLLDMDGESLWNFLNDMASEMEV
jgi:hypothetical protein